VDSKEGEGSAISDTMRPDRVVIGTTSDRARNQLIQLHKPIDTKLVLCNVETAELIKYASNSLLSTKISFANAVAIVAEKVGADVEKVLEGVGLDRRLGRSFLYAGVGYGGSCFPKDVKALIALSEKAGYDFSLLKAVDEVNASMRLHFVDKIAAYFDGDLQGKTIALLGLSFKPDTDDMREAPSITIILELMKRGAEIVVFDPIAMENAKPILPKDIRYAKDAYDAAKNADAVAVVTEWNEFRQLDLVRLAKELKNRVLFDGRNIYDPEQVKKLGFHYEKPITIENEILHVYNSLTENFKFDQNT
jgi:UDPglucose 6-dehydrogenase